MEKNMKKNGLRGLLAAAVTAASLGAAGPAAAADTIRLGLDWGWLPYHAPFLIAIGKGYYEAEGLDVQIEPGRGSGTTAIMLGEGNYDIGHINTTNAAHAIARGVPIEVIAVYQPRTAASFIGLADKVDLVDANSLRNYRIGSTPGGSDQLSLRIFQQANGFEPGDLDIVSLDANTKGAALLSGQIDVISGDGFAYAAVIRGNGQEPEMLLLADYGVPLVGFGFSVNRAFAEAHPDAVKRFLAVTQKAMQEVKQDPTAACEYARSKVELAGGLEQCVDYLSGLIALSTDPADPAWGQQNDQMWSALLGTLKSVGEIEGEVTVGDYYTNDYLPN